jgi:hypothetical protein
MILRLGNLFLLLMLAFPIMGNNKISGYVIDEKTNKPVEFANAYFNGTIYGTFTDTTGYFHLENFEIPSLLIISRIGYETLTFSINKIHDSILYIKLLPKEVIVEEVNIAEKNMREKNLNFFKDLYLGSDVWGKYATIENEEDIYFSKQFDTVLMKVEKDQRYYLSTYRKDLQWNEDSTFVTYQREICFKATCSSPLKIDLPLLGYTLYTDLVYFNWDYDPGINADKCLSLGFYYFQPVKFESKRDSIRICKNRLKAYYNSSQHFLQSLYQNHLLENGYYVLEKYNLDMDGKDLKPVELNQMLVYKDNYAQFFDLKNKNFYIAYYPLADGSPKDLTQKKGYNPIVSEIVFLSDTCTFRSNGTLPDVSIMFRKFMGSKKIGAMLPDNFIPFSKK